MTASAFPGGVWLDLLLPALCPSSTVSSSSTWNHVPGPAPAFAFSAQWAGNGLACCGLTQNRGSGAWLGHSHPLMVGSSPRALRLPYLHTALGRRFWGALVSPPQLQPKGEADIARLQRHNQVQVRMSLSLSFPCGMGVVFPAEQCSCVAFSIKPHSRWWMVGAPEVHREVPVGFEVVMDRVSMQHPMQRFQAWAAGPASGRRQVTLASGAVFLGPGPNVGQGLQLGRSGRSCLWVPRPHPSGAVAGSALPWFRPGLGGRLGGWLPGRT